MRKHSFWDEQFGRPAYDHHDPGTFEPGLVFIMMPFAEEFTARYEVIRDACTAQKLRSTRVDHSKGSGLVIKDIQGLIENGEFLICDLSREKPNVYYELGYAHGVGNEVDDILLVAESNTYVHFDVRPLRCHSYANPSDLRNVVTRELSRMVSTTRARYGIANAQSRRSRKTASTVPSNALPVFEMIRILQDVATTFNGGAALTWLYASNAELDHSSPIMALNTEIGRKKVTSMLRKLGDGGL